MIFVLLSIKLGHYGFGKECNWFVKSIEIKEPLRGKSYFISCNEWLSTEQGDGKTIRKFNVDEATTKISNFSACMYILNKNTMLLKLILIFKILSK